MIDIRTEEERVEEVNAVKIGQVLTGKKTPPRAATVEKLRRNRFELRNSKNVRCEKRVR